MKIQGITTFTKVMGITTWSKYMGVSGAPPPVNWNDIYTFTTNASATLITNWIGANISTSPNVPDIIDSEPVIVNAVTTFNARTTLTNCYIGPNVKFVTNSMNNCFRDCANLVNVDLIPSTVTNMVNTFRGCENLIYAPDIPNKVTVLDLAFTTCTNLVNAPNIGANVTSMYSTFGSCPSLVNAPAIPNKVANTGRTFSGASSLVTAPTLSSNSRFFYETFKNCTSLVGNITIINTGVTNFVNCFYGCNASLAKNLRCPAGSATYNLAINTCNAKNGVTVVAY